jgi:hypothetical protein
MLIIAVVGLIFIYVLTLAFKNKVSFSTPVTRGLRLVQLTLLLTLMALFLLSLYNTYLRNYWIPKIIFWLWFILVMLLFGFGNKKNIYKFENLSYKILFFLPLTFIPLLIIPFIGIGIALRFHVSFIGDNSMILYSSNNIRIEQSYIRFMGPDPPIEIYTKKNLFSYKDTILPIQFNEKLDSLKVTEFASDSIKIAYFKNPKSDLAVPVEEFIIRLNRH